MKTRVYSLCNHGKHNYIGREEDFMYERRVLCTRYLSRSYFPFSGFPSCGLCAGPLATYQGAHSHRFRELITRAT